MSNYLFSKIGLGTIITFRYNAPKKNRNMFEPPRTVMVLSPNFGGHLHAIKITALTPAEQEYLQQLFKVAYSNPQNIFEPLEAQIQQRKKELDTLNAQRNDMLKQGQKVIVSPAPPGLQFMDKAKKVLGSVIGKVSTFGRTTTQVRPATQNNQDIQQQIQKHNQTIQQKKMELDTFVANLNKHKQQIQAMPRVPTDPYSFYHMFLKSFIGNPRRMKQIYRKYAIPLISTPRIISNVGFFPRN